ncbi:MAG: hypothetical protein WDZ94_01535 [Patescibacteria group bacterium]
MKKSIQYTDEPMQPGELVPNLLPPPEELDRARPARIKVTMELSFESLDYFQSYAQKHGGSYQRMIRNLLDIYVHKMKERNNSEKIKKKAVSVEGDAHFSQSR